jgi:Zn-dependent protease with chaperone function
MSIWNERQFRIMNMSSKLRIGPDQMPQYYAMLPPICEKLGIDIPELYLELNVSPNSYTYGDTHPFIVMTSGLFETLPEELIPTVLAHECGHIACHHTMFTTMAQVVLNGASFLPGIANLVTTPMKLALAYWSRCSEFSADRAASIYDETSDKMVEICLRLAGYDKDITANGNVEAFLAQADEYISMRDDSAWNKTLEFLMFNQLDHPLIAVRASECKKWAQSEQFTKIQSYLRTPDAEMLYVKDIPAPDTAKHFIGMSFEMVTEIFVQSGFHNVSLKKTSDKSLLTKEGQVTSICIDDDDNFAKGTWFNERSEIIITYFHVPTQQELATENPGKIQIPVASKKLAGKLYTEVQATFTKAGFTNVELEEQQVKKSLFSKDGTIILVSVDGKADFDIGVWLTPETPIKIIYSKITA